jgi:hypothetical protein
MAELKRQETHHKYSRRHQLQNQQPEQPLKDTIHKISGLVKRLNIPLPQTTPVIRTSEKVESRR